MKGSGLCSEPTGVQDRQDRGPIEISGSFRRVWSHKGLQSGATSGEVPSQARTLETRTEGRITARGGPIGGCRTRWSEVRDPVGH
jgi:hypothetical protein